MAQTQALLRTFAGSCFLLLSSSLAVSEDWYRYRGPRLDGVSSETDWIHTWSDAGPKIAWNSNVGTGLSSFAVSEGRVYTVGNEGDQDTIACLDLESGKSLWQFSYACPLDASEFEGGPTGTPTIDEGRIYFLSRRGDLVCLDKTTGAKRWITNVAEDAEVRIPAWGFSSSPYVHDQLLIVNVGDAGTAVNKHDGTLAWKSADKDSGYSSFTPLPNAKGQLVFGSARSYVCIEAESGLELWRQRWLTTFGCNAADPIAHEEFLFLSSGYNRGSALLDVSGPSPDILWKSKELKNQISTSLLIDGALFGIHGEVGRDAELRCLDFRTGDVLWRNDAIRPGGIAASQNRILLLSDSGELVILSASSEAMKILNRHQVIEGVCWTAPVLSNGRILCRSADGDVVCLDVR